MKKHLSILMISMLAIFAACSNNDGGGDKQIELPTPSEKTQQAYADEQSTGGFTFTAKSTWTATVSEISSKTASAASSVMPASRVSGVSWLRLFIGGTETYSGAAGTFVYVIELDANYTGATRSSTITIDCGDDQITITVTQQGKTQAGVVLEAPKLIKSITETATITSDYDSYNSDYTPYKYEFSYDSKFRLTEMRVLDNAYQLAEKFTLSYDISGEVRVTDSYDHVLLAILDNSGRATKIMSYYSGTSDIFAELTYNTEGFLSRYYSDHAYYAAKDLKLEWSGENLTKTYHRGYDDSYPYEDYYTNTFSQDVNNKTTIDLNVFFFGLNERHDRLFENSFLDDNLFPLVGLTGKRSKNYIINSLEDVGELSFLVEVYAESSLPAIGDEDIWYSASFDGQEGTYTFDAKGYPTSFVRKAEVVKHVHTYNGVKTSVTPTDDNERIRWEERYGLGPWFTITRDYSKSSLYDTYKYTITYD